MLGKLTTALHLRDLDAAESETARLRAQLKAILAEALLR